MPDLSQHRTSGHGTGRKVTMKEVSSRDAVAFTARLIIIMAWLMLFAIAFSIAGGGRIPKVSPPEITLVMVFITGALLVVIAVRRNIISKRLSSWRPAQAMIYHSARVQFFITVGLLYEWRGRKLQRTIHVPAGKATTFLKDRENVTVLVDPERPGRVLIGEVWGWGGEVLP